MIKFRKISQIEKLYHFVDATIDKDALNGDFGSVTTGKFAPKADAKQAIMQVEVGDDMGMPEYKIPAGSHVRVVDLEKLDGQEIEVYGAQLPATFEKGNKLKSDATGKLVTGASQAPYFEVTEIIGNKIGLVAKVVAKTVAAA